MEDYSTPYHFAARHAQTGQVEHFFLDPLASISEVRRRMTKRLGTRPRESWNWVGVKRGDRVIYKAHREDDGGWIRDE